MDLSAYELEALREDHVTALFRGRNVELSSNVLVALPASREAIATSQERFEYEHALARWLTCPRNRPAASTGRVDRRINLYALGVTLYEMLPGTRPFDASSAAEWIHCHIARRPIPLRERVPDASPALEAIALKLLAKRAEDRYQCAVAAESDLRRFPEQLTSTGRIHTSRWLRWVGRPRCRFRRPLGPRKAGSPGGKAGASYRHLSVLAGLTRSEIAERIFDVADQFNRGPIPNLSEEERVRVAQLHLQGAALMPTSP